MIRPAALALLTTMLFAACGTPGKQVQDAGEQASLQPRNERHCYLKVSPGQPMVAEADSFPGPMDSLYVRLDLVGDLANGVYNWLPGGMDAITGTFQGSREGNLITALYTYHTEGMTGKTEVLFRMEQGALQVATGEMTGDSIQVFKDKSRVHFSGLVPEVPCP